MFVGRSGSQWALIRAPDRKTFLIDWESLSSDKSSWSREVCLSIRESKKSAKRFCRLNRDLMDLLIGVTMSSDKSSRSKQLFLVDQGSQWALIRAPDRKKFLLSQGVNEPWSSYRSGCQWALIRAPDHNMFVGRSGSQWALIRAPDHNMFVGRSGSQWALIRASDRKTMLLSSQGLSELW